MPPPTKAPKAGFGADALRRHMQSMAKASAVGGTGAREGTGARAAPTTLKLAKPKPRFSASALAAAANGAAAGGAAGATKRARPAAATLVAAVPLRKRSKTSSVAVQATAAKRRRRHDGSSSGEDEEEDDDETLDLEDDNGDGDGGDNDELAVTTKARQRVSSTGAALALKASVHQLARHPKLPHGALVWVKLGEWPWWPAQLRHASAAPDALLASYLKGQVLVMFLGEPDDNKWNWLPVSAVRPWGGTSGGAGDVAEPWTHEELLQASRMVKFQHASRDASALYAAGTRDAALEAVEARRREAQAIIDAAAAAEEDEDEVLAESQARLARTKEARKALTELKGRAARLHGAADVAVATENIF